MKRRLIAATAALAVVAGAHLTVTSPAQAHTNPGNVHYDRPWVYIRGTGWWHIDFIKVWYYEADDGNPLTRRCHHDIVQFVRPAGLGSHVDTIRHCS